MGQPPGEVAQCIKQLREKKGYTQEELSTRCGFSRTYIGKIERSEKTPSLEALFGIARVLDVSPSQLFQLESAHPRSTEQKQQQSTADRSIFDRYHYLLGTTDTEGRLLSLTAIPLMKNLLKPDRPGERLLWDLDFLELNKPVQSTMKSALRRASLGESNYYQLSQKQDASPERTLDLSIHPLRGDDEAIRNVAFELFLPDDVDRRIPPPPFSIDTMERLEPDAED